MPQREVQISISSNNSDLETNFLDNQLHPEIKFVKNKKENLSYRIFLIDIQKELTHISQSLIEIYHLCRENDAKLVVVILHGDSIDIEKNHYFQKMLDDLGKDKPLHRLIFTKDIYQHYSPTPSTPLDTQFYEAVSSKKINISQKGEKLYFPLALEDFTAAIIKTLFLSNTSGKSFWILGDPIPDLELAYLLKKNISAISQDEPEINATGKDDPKINSLLSIGNKSRGELNWNPQNEIVDDLKQIITLYADSPEKTEIKTTKTNPLHRLLNWVYQPRPKKENSLPTFRKIGTNLLIVALATIALMVGSFFLTTGLSLLQLEKSINHALEGNLQQSISSLNNTTKFKEIGESIFSPLVPLSNLVSPRSTEKIFNLYSFIDYASSSLGNLHQTYVMAENLLLSLNNEETKTNYDDLSLALHSNLSQIYENLNQISFLSSNGKLPSFLEKKLKNNEEYKNLKNLEEQVAQFIKVTDIIPAVLSGDTAKNILVYLQNSQILRPSGGEIDYYLLLTLKQGKLIAKKYLTEPELDNLYQNASLTTPKNNRFASAPTPKLIDLVQNPDFSKSSIEVSTYFEKALKTKPDFIIATNNLLIEQLLLEEKSPIIDQYKASYLEASGSAVYQEIFDQYLDRFFNQNISLSVLGRTIAKTIGDNQILIWSSDTNTQRLLTYQSYSGVVTPHPCNAGIASSNICTAQTLFLSESTILPSRKNPWSKRLLSHTIEIVSSSIQHEYQVSYTTNQSSSPDYSIANTYYLYVPTPSTLDKVLLNDLPSSTKSVTKTTEGSFDVYKIPLAISSNKDASVVIKTTTFSNQTFSTPLSYSITEYHQPGTTDTGTTLKIIYPRNLFPKIVTSPFTSEPAAMRVTLPPHTSTFGFTLDQNMQ